MALAVLTMHHTSDGSVEAMADIGSNSYFEFVVGSKDENAYGSRWGDEEMVVVAHRSGPSEAPRGLNPLSRQFRFSVPLQHFDREHRDLQLISYADRNRNSAAYSRIFRVAPMIQSGRFDMGDYEHGPPRTMALSGGLDYSGRSLSHLSDVLHHGADLSAARPVRRIPLSFQESAISRAQFVDGLVQVIQAVAPTLLEALPQLLGSGRNTGSSATQGSGNGNGGGLNTDVLVALLRQVVAALPSGDADGTASSADAPPPEPPPLAAAASMRRHVSHPLGQMFSERRYAAAFGARRERYAQQMDGGLLSGPLLATLLGPLIQQAPQLLGVLADKPLDFLSTIIRAEAENDLQRERNQQAFIRELLAETNRSVLLDQLVQRMGGDGGAALLPLLAQASSTPGSARAETARGVTLRFDTGRQIEVGGKLKSLFFSRGDGIDLRIVLHPTGDPPKSPLPRAIADLTITDPATGQTHCRKSFRLREIWTERPVLLHLEEEVLAHIPRHKDLHVSVSLRWPTSHGRSLGVRGHHAICLIDGSVFAGFGPSMASSSVLHLSHPGDHRAFWNKIWEGSTTADPKARRWEIDVLCRYYVLVTGAEDSNGRMETRIAPAPPGNDPNEVSGRMRAGMEYSVDVLNDALSLVADPLTPTELAALKRADLRADLDLEATTRLRLRGKDHELGVIWAFPSLMLREAYFLEPMAQDDFGQVTEMSRRTRSFPVPNRIHFLPMKTKR